jgi:hypothetical protein
LSAKDSLVARSPAVDQSAITRVVTVAGGRFAPGHLGELTRQVPFEMTDAVKIYAHCIDGQADAANKRTTDALGVQDTGRESEPGDEGDDDIEQTS